MALQKTISILLVLVALGLIFQLNSTNWLGMNDDSITPTEQAFFLDFIAYMKKLKEEKNSPPQLNSIQYIKYVFHAGPFRQILGRHHLPIPTLPAGQNILEADFIVIPETNNSEFILQLGIIELKTGNKIWENSSNFSLPNSKNKKARSEN